jgi:hypothetical protein
VHFLDDNPAVVAIAQHREAERRAPDSASALAEPLLTEVHHHGYGQEQGPRHGHGGRRGEPVAEATERRADE